MSRNFLNYLGALIPSGCFRQIFELILGQVYISRLAELILTKAQIYFVLDEVSGFQVIFRWIANVSSLVDTVFEKLPGDIYQKTHGKWGAT